MCEFAFSHCDINRMRNLNREKGRCAFVMTNTKLSLPFLKENLLLFLQEKWRVKNECNNNKWVNNINVMHIRCLQTNKYCIYSSITNFVLKSVFSYVLKKEISYRYVWGRRNKIKNIECRKIARMHSNFEGRNLF